MRSNLSLAQCFAILNLPETASFEEIKAARLRIVIELHPDRYADKPRLRQVVEEELKTVNAAFDFLEMHFGQTSSRDRARASETETDTASAGAGSRSGFYTGDARSRSTHGPSQSQSSSSGVPHGRISLRTFVRVGKKIALPLLLFSIGCTWFGISLFKTYVTDPYKIKARNNRPSYDRREAVPTVPPPPTAHAEQTPTRDEPGSKPKTTLESLSPERRAEIFETTRVYVYPPTESAVQFGANEHKWSPERRRWVAILTSHEPDPFTVKVLETQGEDSKIEFVIRNQTLSGWVKSKQIATIVP